MKSNAPSPRRFLFFSYVTTISLHTSLMWRWSFDLSSIHYLSSTNALSCLQGQLDVSTHFQLEAFTFYNIYLGTYNCFSVKQILIPTNNMLSSLHLEGCPGFYVCVADNQAGRRANRLVGYKPGRAKWRASGWSSFCNNTQEVLSVL